MRRMSREATTTAGAGSISPLLKRLLPFDDFEFYLCGAPPFMRSLYCGLLSLDVSENRIHYEFFGPASTLKPDAQPIGPAQAPSAEAELAGGIQVTFARSGVTANWGPGLREHPGSCRAPWPEPGLQLPLGHLPDLHVRAGRGRGRVPGGTSGRARPGLRVDLLFEAQDQPCDRGVKAGELRASRSLTRYKAHAWPHSVPQPIQTRLSAQHETYTNGFRSPSIVGINSATVGVNVHGALDHGVGRVGIHQIDQRVDDLVAADSQN